MKQSILKCFNKVLGVLKVQAERRLDSKNVAINSAFSEEKLSFSRQLHHLVSLILSWLLGLLVLHKLNTDHQSLASDIPNYSVLLLELS